MTSIWFLYINVEILHEFLSCRTELREEVFALFHVFYSRDQNSKCFVPPIFINRFYTKKEKCFPACFDYIYH